MLDRKTGLGLLLSLFIIPALASIFGEPQDPLTISHTQEKNIHLFDLLNLNQQPIGQLDLRLSQDGNLEVILPTAREQSAKQPACGLQLVEPNLYSLAGGTSSCYFRIRSDGNSSGGTISVSDGNKSYHFDLKQ